MGILPSCSYDSTSVWLKSLDFNETLREKNLRETTWRCSVLFGTNPRSSTLQNSNCTATYHPSTWEKQHEDAVYCLEQTQGAALYKTVTVQPLTTHQTNHLSKMSKASWAPLVKLGQIYKRYSPLDSYIWTYQCWPTSIYLHLFALCWYLILSRGLTKSVDW